MKSTKHFLYVFTALVLCIFCLTACNRNTDESPYLKAISNGYTGSEEEWIAALVGEELSTNAEELSAYEVACDMGYSKDVKTWMKDITGVSSSDENKTAYTVSCENGYDGSFADWLAGTCDNPDELGKSAYGESKTEYEYACEYGYEGTFIEWMISLINDKNL